MRSHLPSGEAETLVTPSSTLAHTADQSLTMMRWSWPCLTRRRRHVLFPGLDRHIEFRNVVPFPLAPEGLAQAGRHGLALVLQHNDQPGLFFRVARGAMQNANGFVGTLGNDQGRARFVVYGSPRASLVLRAFLVSARLRTRDARDIDLGDLLRCIGSVARMNGVIHPADEGKGKLMPK